MKNDESEPSPKVNFHWKIMMAPVSVIEYVIVHELAHFKHKRHNAQFWNEVDKILPNYQNQITWLKQKGASLDI
ncbi:MAG: M48 family metallopeptidase [Candidatus Desantisbacteria bacterium]